MRVKLQTSPSLNRHFGAVEENLRLGGGIVSYRKEFEKKMKKLILYVVLGIVFIVLVSTTYFVIKINEGFKKSEPYLLAIETIRQNKTNIPIINNDLEVSYLVGGSRNSNEAHFHFKIYSQDKTFVVYVDLKKDQNQTWKITDFEAKEK